MRPSSLRRSLSSKSVFKKNNIKIKKSLKKKKRIKKKSLKNKYNGGGDIAMGLLLLGTAVSAQKSM